MIEHVQYTEAGMIRALIDGTEWIVPDDIENRHRQMIAEWEAAGNTIQPYEPPASTLEDFRLAVQAHVDTAAISKRYNDSNALAGYVASTNPQWAAEAQAFVAWRDAVWIYAYAELDKVMGGTREIPTIEDFIAELPVINWPV